MGNSHSTRHPSDLKWTLPAFKWMLGLFVVSIFFSVAGMLLLRVYPPAYDIFGAYYQELVKAPTWTYMAVLPVLAILLYGPRIGWRRIGIFFIWGCLIGGLSELIGTTTGQPFGEYYYTHWLGPQIAGHVPYFIPPSWFALSVICLDLARRVAKSMSGRILIGTVFMVLWDVSLDPAMSQAFPFWVFPEGGLFFGMPLNNWVGWFIVTLIIISGYEYWGGLSFSSRWAPPIYALNCLFPIAISLLQNVIWPAVIGFAAMLIPLVWVYYRGTPPDDGTIQEESHTLSETPSTIDKPADNR